jgi:1-acyl-sn-glycerol-3-phosphate acyltransferase
MVPTFRRVFTRHMNALRISRWGMPAVPRQGPLIVYSNHPGWWDAVIFVLAADRFFSDYESYAPIDAAMLRRYGVLGRIGAFGIDLESSRGAAHFLKAGADILSAPNRAFWITSQGRFVDVRERPLGLKGGVARLVERAPACTVLPLAIEYGFWLERGAEACIAFGEPMRGDDLSRLPRPTRLQQLEGALTATLDRLSADVRSRDSDRFQPLIEGRAGIGGIYDGWRRLRSTMQGRTFDPSHEGGAS